MRVLATAQATRSDPHGAIVQRGDATRCYYDSAYPRYDPQASALCRHKWRLATDAKQSSLTFTCCSRWISRLTSCRSMARGTPDCASATDATSCQRFACRKCAPRFSFCCTPDTWHSLVYFSCRAWGPAQSAGKLPPARRHRLWPRRLPPGCSPPLQRRPPPVPQTTAAGACVGTRTACCHQAFGVTPTINSKILQQHNCRFCLPMFQWTAVSCPPGSERARW